MNPLKLLRQRLPLPLVVLVGLLVGLFAGAIVAQAVDGELMRRTAAQLTSTVHGVWWLPGSLELRTAERCAPWVGALGGIFAVWSVFAVLELLLLRTAYFDGLSPL